MSTDTPETTEELPEEMRPNSQVATPSGIKGDVVVGSSPDEPKLGTHTDVSGGFPDIERVMTAGGMHYVAEHYYRRLLNISGEQMPASEFYKCHFEECDFSGCDFRNTVWTNTVFIKCDFTDANLEGAVFLKCKIRDIEGLVGWDQEHGALPLDPDELSEYLAVLPEANYPPKYLLSKRKVKEISMYLQSGAPPAEAAKIAGVDVAQVERLRDDLAKGTA